MKSSISEKSQNEKMRKCPQKVRVEHKICSTMCGTLIQATRTLDSIRLAGGTREGQNLPQKWPKFGLGGHIINFWGRDYK